jgi:hypothetical protein
MRAFAAVSLAAVLLAPVTAHAAPAAPAGPPCHDPSYWTATGAASVDAVAAGPIVLRERGGANPLAGSVTCTLRDSWGTALWSASSPVATGVVTLAPTAVTRPPDADWLCTRVTLADGRSWDDYFQAWTANASELCWYVGPREPCDSVTDPACGGLGPVLYTVVPRTLDGLICPELAEAFPPYGDVPDVWDCPPYWYQS